MHSPTPTPWQHACRHVATLLLAVMLPAVHAAPSADPTADAAAQAGQRLYREGLGRQGAPLQAQVASGVRLEGEAAACARCHGASGRGTRDAGLQVPALQWATLTRERAAGPGVMARPAYDEALLLRALRTGLDAAGRPLGAAMPRFELAPRDAADLLQHLRRLGTDAERQPGVDTDRVRLGTVLPRGAGDAGRALVAGLRACLERSNRAGGVYGRRLELEVFEAPAEPSDAAALAAAAAPWRERVLLLVAPWWPQTEARTLAQALGPLPVLGPLGLAAELDGTPRWWFGVAPQRVDQARVLIDRAAADARRLGGPVWLLADGDAASQAARRAAEAQAALHDGLQLQVHTVRDAAALDGWLAAQPGPPAAVLALLPPAWMQRLLPLAQAPGVTVYALLQQQGGSPLAWPASAQQPLRLAAATPLAEAFDPRDWLADLQALGETSRAPALQAPAYASACAAAEALRHAGRALDRDTLLQGLQSVQQLATGVLPPLSFGPRQRSGVWESRLVRVADDGRGFEPAGPWLSPRQPP